MSYQDLELAINIIEDNREKSDFDGFKDEDLILLAESTLGIKFPLTYRNFLSRYGCGSIAGQEFYGVIQKDFINSGIPDAIWLTLNERLDSNLPNNLVIVYSQGDGDYFAIDCSIKNINGESPVVSWVPGYSSKEDNLELIADDYGAFFLKIVSLSLS